MKAILLTLLLVASVYCNKDEPAWYKMFYLVKDGSKEPVDATLQAACCYPSTEPINFYMRGDEIIFSWTWESSTACTGLSAVDQSIAVPSNRILHNLDVPTAAGVVNFAFSKKGDTAIITLPQSSNCKISIIKSSSVLGLGFLAILSFVYLLF